MIPVQTAHLQVAAITHPGMRGKITKIVLQSPRLRSVKKILHQLCWLSLLMEWEGTGQVRSRLTWQ